MKGFVGLWISNFETLKLTYLFSKDAITATSSYHCYYLWSMLKELAITTFDDGLCRVLDFDEPIPREDKGFKVRFVGMNTHT